MNIGKKEKTINLEKISPRVVGMIQSAGAAIYCGLISGFFWLMEKISVKSPQILTATLMLFLLVFSAAVTGLLIFGYPIYLGFKGQIKRALAILGYTFLCSIAIILIILFLIFL